MLSLLSLIVIVTFSILITKIAAVMLVHTGLSDQVAQFQARSAFTGVGFVTKESESVVNHPVRRRIIMTLMLFGNAGIITAMASLILTFVGPGDSSISWPVKTGILILSILILWFIASSQIVNKALNKLIRKALKRYTTLVIRDYNTLFRLSGGFSIKELKIEKDSWLSGKKLKNAKLSDEGINVLGIQHPDGNYLGVPTAETEIVPGDTLLIYGPEDVLNNLEERKNDFFGDIDHTKTAIHQKEILEVDQKLEEERRNENKKR